MRNMPMPPYRTSSRTKTGRLYGDWRPLNLSTCLFINDGDGQFHTDSLPYEAQMFPVRCATFADVNGDGKTDLILAGNLQCATRRGPDGCRAGGCCCCKHLVAGAQQKTQKAGCTCRKK